MLSSHDISIIKSTVPVLEVHGKDITTCFYKMLFEHHPELLNIFNHANQKKGKQQAALANMVYAAAKYIDQLEVVLPAVKEVAQKHRSLGVLPDHYPIVGKYLLLAIKEVLGDAATDEIIHAWNNAYGVIASVFIDIEKEMYEQAEGQEGGWTGFRSFTVNKIVEENELIRSFYLIPSDGGAIASFTPGQYVSVKVQVPGETYTQIRQYSLSAAPHEPYYRISVKRENGALNTPDGKVSNYLHNVIKEGDQLLLSAPAGEFKLELNDERPVVLIGGGIGVTPLMSMMSTAVKQQPNRQVTFIHAAQNGKVHAMGSEVKQLEEANEHVTTHFCYSNPLPEDTGYSKAGRIDQAWLQEIAPTTDAHFYFCGPLSFMKSIRDSLISWGVREEDLHYEFFGPKEAL
ncbi:NO-inducible flavohemoprotein [Paenibacillus sp. An7]|uniref:NO-inducible flavohemoprotein n=1 Tax=Paenibacillus sp. An7 TaxID=2689577 RepID=UPI001358568B|nr:NO-inducible flavohemoprotein [Paenibacillus sp. An7]